MQQTLLVIIAFNSINQPKATPHFQMQKIRTAIRSAFFFLLIDLKGLFRALLHHCIISESPKAKVLH